MNVDAVMNEAQPVNLQCLAVTCPGILIRNGTLQLGAGIMLRVTAPGARFEGVTISGSGGRMAVRGGRWSEIQNMFC